MQEPEQLIWAISTAEYKAHNYKGYCYAFDNQWCCHRHVENRRVHLLYQRVKSFYSGLIKSYPDVCSPLGTIQMRCDYRWIDFHFYLRVGIYHAEAYCSYRTLPWNVHS